ncbi:MAG: thioredoxin domain-containing protein [Deltaproteobacteria bacterium]|nr:thioredoxin domain-containing protein [Deltaproteobacteria bacterium]MBW2354201.1 thioredoxin domain-containing protein [Deltaproteobacteria bacterium]
MLKKYPESVKIVFKNYPLKNHKFAVRAAAAALAAGRQGKFWEFHDELFKDYRQLSEEKLLEIAHRLGLNKAQFERDRKDPEILASIQRDSQEAVRIGVTGVPALFVNGRRISNRDLRVMDRIIEKEKEKVQKP